MTRPIPSWAARLELIAEELIRVARAPYGEDVPLAAIDLLEAAQEELRTGVRVESWHTANDAARERREIRRQQLERDAGSGRWSA